MVTLVQIAAVVIQELFAHLIPLIPAAADIHDSCWDICGPLLDLHPYFDRGCLYQMGPWFSACNLLGSNPRNLPFHPGNSLLHISDVNLLKVLLFF